MFEFICGPCCTDGRGVEAEGYCATCREYLCNLCFKCHLRPTPTRSHKLLSKAEMPNKQRTQTVLEDDYHERCRKHADKYIEYFCQKHDHVGCSACITLDHRLCKDVLYIDNVRQNVLESREYTRTVTQLKRLISEFEKQKRKSHSNLKKIDDDFRRATNSIKVFRKNINTYFDILEHEVSTKVMKNREHDTDRMNTISDHCERAAFELDKVVTELEYRHSQELQKRLFVGLKRIKGLLKRFEGNLENIERDNRVSRYQFERAPEISEALKGLEQLGYLRVVKDPEDQQLQLVETIDARCEHDSAPSVVAGLDQLSEKYLILADSGNSSVKLLNLDEKSVEAHFQLSTAPTDIAVVSQEKVAVTLPDIMSVQFVIVSRFENSSCQSDSSSCCSESTDRDKSEINKPVLHMGETIKVKGKCNKLVYNCKRLIVSFLSPPKIEMISMEGNVLNRFDMDITGKSLFQSPASIAVNQDFHSIYVADSGANKVMCLSVDGKIAYEYKSVSSRDITGLALGESGIVYLCSSESDIIHQLAHDCIPLRHFVMPKLDLGQGTASILHTFYGERIFLGQNDRITIIRIV